jgi:putative DNA primase/helicase
MLRRKSGARELGVNLDALAQYLGGTITTGNTITFPGPGHSSSDRSASVTFTPEAWNGVFKSWSYANRDEVPEIEGIVFDALDAIGWTGEGIEGLAMSAGEKKEAGRDRALNAWGFGRDAAGSPVEVYLGKRAIRLPPGDEIRFSRYGRFGRDVAPLMLAAVRSIETDEMIAVHRTALTLEGEKSYHDLFGNMDCRAYLGSPKGGAIKLFSLGPKLGIGEGIETTLSLREFEGLRDLPVWSMGSARGLATLPVLEGVEELIVAEDADGDGVAAASEVAARWLEAGRKVRVIGTRNMADQGLNDLNDLIRRATYGKKEEARKRGRGLG